MSRCRVNRLRFAPRGTPLTKIASPGARMVCQVCHTDIAPGQVYLFRASSVYARCVPHGYPLEAGNYQ